MNGKRPEIGVPTSTEYTVRDTIKTHFSKRNGKQDEAEWGIFIVE
jgi:hypothetical protein